VTQIAGLVRVTDAEIEPLTVDEVTRYVRGLDDEATTIELLIAAARGQAEHETNRAFITQTWRATLDDFPRSNVSSPFSSSTAYGAGGYLPYDFGSSTIAAVLATRLAIRVPKPPLLAVSSIIYRDPTGAAVTLDPSLYIVDPTSLPGRIVPAVGTAWPATQPGLGAVAITFTAGYGPAANNVPAEIKMAIALGVGHLYRTRESELVGATIVENPTVKALLARHVFVQLD
jgi:hypothetical protein